MLPAVDKQTGHVTDETAISLKPLYPVGHSGSGMTLIHRPPRVAG